MPAILIVAVEVLSALATVGIVYSTSKPCKASGIPYLLGVPAAFGLMAIAFATNAVITLLPGNMFSLGLLLSVVFVLTQTYGMLFLAITYARRTRLRFIGESTPLELALPGLVTVGVVLYVLVQRVPLGVGMPDPAVFSLRAVMAICSLYLVYETERSWSLLKRASESLIVIAFALFFVEQLGFMLNELSLGEVTIFLGYEGRVVGLFLLVAITFVGIRKDDLRTVLKRLGLVALAHSPSST